MHQAGHVPQYGDRVVVVEVPAEPLLVRQPGHPHHHRVAERARGRRTAWWPPRRAAGPRRCAGTPGTGSPAPAACRPARRPSPSPRIEVSSSRVSKTRAAPNRSRSPFVTPYTPPLAATSSPKTAICGVVEQPVGERGVDASAPASAGRPARAACRRTPRPARPRPARRPGLPRRPPRGPPAPAGAAPAGRPPRRRRRASARRAPPRRSGGPASRSRRTGPAAPRPVATPAVDEQPGGGQRPGPGPGRRRSPRACGTPISASAPACPISRTVRRCSTAGRRCRRTQAAASAATVVRLRPRSPPSAAK